MALLVTVWTAFLIDNLTYVVFITIVQLLVLAELKRMCYVSVLFVNLVSLTNLYSLRVRLPSS